MSNRIEPFYPLHKIKTGLYTPGDEYILWEDFGTEYIGLYHMLPNGTAWTKSAPGNDTKKLILKQFEVSESVKTYNKNRKIESNNYTNPVNVKPEIIAEDYITGEILRYFVQKRNNPIPTIFEISRDQYLALNTSNKPGINGTIWNVTALTWKLSGKLAGYFNTIALGRAEIHFPGIQIYLDDPLEFTK